MTSPRYVSRENLLLYSRRGKSRDQRPDDSGWLGLNWDDGATEFACSSNWTA
jgi:hypothetical protein